MKDKRFAKIKKQKGIVHVAEKRHHPRHRSCSHSTTPPSPLILGGQLGSNKREPHTHIHAQHNRTAGRFATPTNQRPTIWWSVAALHSLTSKPSLVWCVHTTLQSSICACAPRPHVAACLSRVKTTPESSNNRRGAFTCFFGCGHLHFSKLAQSNLISKKAIRRPQHAAPVFVFSLFFYSQ